MRARLFRWLDDAMNPVLLKELRQAVRSRFIATALILSLLAEVVVIVARFTEQQLGEFGLASAALGQQTFGVLFGAVVFVCAIAVPMYTGMRIAAERSDTNTDLMFITTISPWTIVSGKLLAVTAAVLLVFGAALPFFAFAYVLRGIDLMVSSTAVVIAILFVVTEAVLALFVGALPASRPFKTLLGLLAAVGALTSIVPIIAYATGSFTRISSIDSEAVIGIILCFAVVDAVFLVLTAAVMTPPAANRALPIRVMLTILWSVTFVGVNHAAIAGGKLDVLLFWAWGAFGFITIVLLSASGERETWGRRVTRRIPSNPLLRALAFPFYSGAAGGTLWACGMFAATIAAFHFAAGRVPHATFSTPISPARLIERATWQIIAGALCVIGYALTAVRLHRRYLARRIAQKHTWAVAFVLLLVFGIVVPLVATYRYFETPEFEGVYAWSTLFNPFPASNEPRVIAPRIAVLASWCAIVMLMNLRWATGQWSRFRRTVTQAAGA
jgi:hypothetical protein